MSTFEDRTRRALARAVAALAQSQTEAARRRHLRRIQQAQQALRLLAYDTRRMGGV